MGGQVVDSNMKMDEEEAEIIISHEEFDGTDDIDVLINHIQKRSKVKDGKKMIIEVKERKNAAKASTLVESFEKIGRESCERCNNHQQEEGSTHKHWPENWFFDIYLSTATYTVTSSSCYMASPPSSIFLLPNVESLSIVRCGLTKLPPYIGLLKHLTTLNLEDNYLQSLPETLRYCKKLKTLKLASNSMSSLPGFLLQLPNLTTISRNNNNFHRSGATNADSFKELEMKENVVVPDSFTMPLRLKMTSLLSEFRLIDPEKKILPNGLKEEVNRFYKEVLFCCSCQKDFFRNNGGYKVLLWFEQFHGYSNIPFEGLVCSRSCGENLNMTWDRIIKEESKAQSSQEDSSANSLDDIVSDESTNDISEWDDLFSQEQFCFDVPDVIPPPHSCYLCRKKRCWLLCS